MKKGKIDSNTKRKARRKYQITASVIEQSTSSYTIQQHERERENE